MAALKEEKASTERELEQLNLPLLVCSECLSNRDGRRSAELTYDLADTELKKVLFLRRPWSKIPGITTVWQCRPTNLTLFFVFQIACIFAWYFSGKLIVITFKNEPICRHLSLSTASLEFWSRCTHDYTALTVANSSGTIHILFLGTVRNRKQ